MIAYINVVIFTCIRRKYKLEIALLSINVRKSLEYIKFMLKL